MTARAKTKDAETIFTAVATFAGVTPDGFEHSIAKGERVRGDHPARVFWHGYLVRDGASSEETAQAGYAIEDNRPDSGPVQMLRAKRDIYPDPGAGQLWDVRKGTELPFDHPATRGNRKDWELIDP